MMTFKEYNEAPSVSFDFDDTIFMLDWDKKTNDYVRDERGDPTGTLNKDIAQKIKDYKIQGYRVYVITSRQAIWREETEEYLRDNNLMGYIDDVVFTNGAWKASRCKKYGVSVHYDDDPGELRRLKYKNITGIQVRNPNY